MLHTLLFQVVAQVFAKGLSGRHEDATVADGVALHKVELSITVGLHVGIQAVQSHHLQQRRRLQLLLGQIGQIGTCGVALVFDVHAELFFLDGRGQIIDVLHHQAPVGLHRTVLGVLQGLHEEALVGLRQVGRELTHLIGLSAIGVFVGHSQHLVGLQSCLQRHIAQGRVHRIFARCQQAGRGQLLVVHTTHHRCAEALELHGDLVDVARGRVDVLHQRRVDIVGQIAGHRHACGVPVGILQIFILTQLAECHDVARIRGTSRLVGHPNLHTVNLDARGEVGQRAHSHVVGLAEEV